MSNFPTFVEQLDEHIKGNPEQYMGTINTFNEPLDSWSGYRNPSAIYVRDPTRSATFRSEFIEEVRETTQKRNLDMLKEREASLKRAEEFRLANRPLIIKLCTKAFEDLNKLLK